MRPAQSDRSPPVRWPVAAVACACWIPAGCSSRVERPPAPTPPTVSVVAARRMDVPIELRAIATTVALQQVSIRARVRGILRERHFEAGDDVRKGQLLFVIDETPFRAELEADRARLVEARDVLEKARHSRAREIARAFLEVAKDRWECTRIEEAAGARPPGLRRDPRRGSRTPDRPPHAGRGRGRGREDRARESPGRSRPHDSGRRGRGRRRRDAVRQSEINLDYCRIHSPIDGRVGAVKVHPGDLVEPSARSQDRDELTTIQQLDPIGVDIPVDSRFLPRAASAIRQGLPVKIVRPVTQGDHNCPGAGMADFIDIAPDPGRLTFRCRARVSNPKRTLLPGQSVRAVVTGFR